MAMKFERYTDILDTLVINVLDDIEQTLKLLPKETVYLDWEHITSFDSKLSIKGIRYVHDSSNIEIILTEFKDDSYEEVTNDNIVFPLRNDYFTINDLLVVLKAIELRVK